MTTLRFELSTAGFDWNTGRILVQYTEDPNCWGWNSPGPTLEITKNDPILDAEFDPSFGAPKMPAFVAEDSEKIYFPIQYDGATNVDYVHKNLDEYFSEPHPYPGG